MVGGRACKNPQRQQERRRRIIIVVVISCKYEWNSSSGSKLCISEGHCYGILKEVRNNPTCINLSPKLEHQKTILGKEGKGLSTTSEKLLCLVGRKEGPSL